MIETCNCCGFYKIARNDCPTCRVLRQRQA